MQEACFPLTPLEKRTVTFQLHSGLLSNILNCNLVITINVALKDYLMKEITLGTSIIMAPSSLSPTYLEKFPTVAESEDEYRLPVLNNRLHTASVKTCCFWCTRARTVSHAHTYTYLQDMNTKLLRSDSRQVEQKLLASAAVFNLRWWDNDVTWRNWSLSSSVLPRERFPRPISHLLLGPF